MSDAKDPEPEVAAMAMALLEEFGKMKPNVRRSVANNIMGLLAKVLEQTRDRVGEEQAHPLAVGVAIMEALFKANGRVVFLRDAEAGITFHQPSALLLPTGETSLSINFIPTKKGHGERASGAAGLALKLLNEHAGQAAHGLISH